MESSYGDVIPETKGLFSFGETSFHFDCKGRVLGVCGTFSVGLHDHLLQLVSNQVEKVDFLEGFQHDTFSGTFD